MSFARISILEVTRLSFFNAVDVVMKRFSDTHTHTEQVSMTNGAITVVQSLNNACIITVYDLEVQMYDDGTKTSSSALPHCLQQKLQRKNRGNEFKNWFKCLT